MSAMMAVDVFGVFGVIAGGLSGLSGIGGGAILTPMLVLALGMTQHRG